jgi:hypothetical protein
MRGPLFMNIVALHHEKTPAFHERLSGNSDRHRQRSWLPQLLRDPHEIETQ